MAKIDELVAEVGDDDLRARIADAVAELRQRKKFGLVFEEHVPETALLARHTGLEAGNEVTLRTKPADSTRYRVESVSKTEARISDGATTQSVPIMDLLVVSQFGQPIYPVLALAHPPVVRSAARPFHTVINGENFHALQLLLFAYEGQVDCIFIDPPYNTGARDWKYNNDYVDGNDGWRHSKWLSMMEKRLKLSRRLLKPDGVLIVTIDEHELHHLGILLEQIFPQYLRYMVSIVINGRGSTGTRNFASIEEQALFLVPDLGYDLISAREGRIPGFHTEHGDGPSTLERLLTKVANADPDIVARLLAQGVIDEEEAGEWQQAASIEPDEDEDHAAEEDGEGGVEVVPEESDPAVYWRGAVRTGQGTSFRVQRPNQFYPLYMDLQNPDDLVVGAPVLERDVEGTLVAPSWLELNGLTPIWPVDEDGGERVWCFEPGRMAAEIAKGNIKVGRFNPKRNTFAVNVRRVRRTKQRFRERTIWWEKSYDAGSNGTNVLKRLLGSSGLFDFPKSIYAVRDALACAVGSRPDALILDFFAGSGTTLHSTLLLNAIDDGRRRCILVTNNEVSEEHAAKLNAAGNYRGDAEYEAMGIARRVTLPRVKAAITGRRPDGTKIVGAYKWASGRPYGDGFPENAAFFDLTYQNPVALEVGEHFEDILPALWLAAGAVGDPSSLTVDEHWFINEGVTFAVLLDEDRFSAFAKLLRVRTDVSHAWITTDSEAAFARMRDRLPSSLHVGMLYRDYLRNFRINAEVVR